jgi:lipooligosaccharide transport system permease protein
MLLGLGYSVGSYVDAAGGLGLPYVDYIAPGLLASTVLQLAIAESDVGPVLGRVHVEPHVPRDARLAAAPPGHGRR